MILQFQAFLKVAAFELYSFAISTYEFLAYAHTDFEYTRINACLVSSFQRQFKCIALWYARLYLLVFFVCFFHVVICLKTWRACLLFFFAICVNKITIDAAILFLSIEYSPAIACTHGAYKHTYAGVRARVWCTIAFHIDFSIVRCYFYLFSYLFVVLLFTLCNASPPQNGPTHSL